ncbi:hypothetical protein [Rhizobium sp. CC-YZS058]|uniref:hypothetical protein n=1 Tax=Rhizobium sp. CC-YZS058 TaxID=3042153 RepID=UPI002B0535BB|nr:hypothetical protein [Rhizobium sp. CC-YZS058]MEA3535046.1 hypothetical protein [Rhizobium sp. CC-YZS058]
MPKGLHELAKAFPEHLAMIRHLNETDGHFHRISGAFREVSAALVKADGKAGAEREALAHRQSALKAEILELLTRPETVEDILP